MIKVLILLFGLVSFAHAGEFRTDDQWTGRDKTLHFALGGLAGAAVTAYTEDAITGILAGCAVGVAKEVYDLKRGESTFQDAAVTCLGAALGSKIVEGLYLTPRGIGLVKRF